MCVYSTAMSKDCFHCVPMIIFQSPYRRVDHTKMQNGPYIDVG